MLKIKLLLLFLVLLVEHGTVFAAQSTDVKGSTIEDKKRILNEVIGKKTNMLPSQDEYVIGHGDILTVSIFEEGNMSAVVTPGTTAQGGTSGMAIQVMMDGRISLRDIGDVEVVGLTLTELANYLKRLYEVIYTDPIVTTTLLKSNSLRYTVMGEVKQPGVFLLEQPMTLVQIIARSGGFSQWAEKEITLVRERTDLQIEGLFKDNTLEFDYDDFISGKDLKKNVQVYSGDYIIVH